jgi:hypothetical protein
LAAATTSSPNTSPQRPKALLEVTIGRSRTPPTTFVLGLGQPGCDPPRRGILVPILRVAGTPPGTFLRGSSSPLGPVQPAEPRTHAASGSRYRRKGAYRSGPFHRGQRHTDHRLDDEPSSASRAVASPSPSIAARQPRSAQSCCATAPAAARRVEVVVLAVISILLFALSFQMFTGLFRRPQAMCPHSPWLACARKPYKTRFTAFAHCAQGPTPGRWHHSQTRAGPCRSQSLIATRRSTGFTKPSGRSSAHPPRCAARSWRPPTSTCSGGVRTRPAVGITRSQLGSDP